MGMSVVLVSRTQGKLDDVAKEIGSYLDDLLIC
jgi:short-subunit dehydrogenase